MRDNLKFKLGLRLTQEVDVSKLGICYLHLGKNKISNIRAILLAKAIKQDAYMWGVNLRHNKIDEADMLELIHVAHCNKIMLSLDILENHHCYTKKKLNERFK